MYNDVHLIKVEPGENNNKFYDMHDNGDNTFTATWGRIDGGTPQTKKFPIGLWRTKYDEKTSNKKGYVDMSDARAKVGEYKDIQDSEINTLLNAFLECSRQYVSHFTESTAISDKYAQEAQDHINAMAKNIDIPNPTPRTLYDFNEHLLELFKIIPRKMKNVRESMCQSLDNRKRYVIQEQNLLDNLVNLAKNTPSSSGTQTIEDAFGFTIQKCSQTEIDFIKKKLADDGFYRYKFNRAWKINTPQREEDFAEFLENNHLQNNDKNVKLYWHGTGTENILSILANGLLIKPANSSFCGSCYGVGIYNAPNADKASGYTSIAGSYWKGGSSNVAYMFINAVIMGRMYDVQNNYETYNGITIRNLNGDNFSSADLGFHSVYAHAGGYLKRDEAIVYNQSQVACRYLVEFKV